MPCGSSTGSASTTSSIGARSAATQATTARRLGNALLNRLASYLTDRESRISRPGSAAARRECLLEFLHLLPNGFSTPTTTTLAFIKAGYSVGVRAHRGASSASAQSKIKLARDGAKFFLILLKIITIFSPLQDLRAGQRRHVRARLRLRDLDDHQAVARHELVGAADHAGGVIFLVGLVSEQISALRFERRQ